MLLAKMGFGLGLGARQGGDTQLTLPQAANIIRAWGMRRLVPAFGKGLALLADRANPSPADAEPAYFNDAGKLSIAAGLSAYACDLYDQKGAAASELLNATYAACPKVFDATTGLFLGLEFDGSNDNLQMGSADAALETCFVSTAHTIALWFKTTTAATKVLLQRSSVTSGFQTIVIANGILTANMNKNSLGASTVDRVDDGKWHLMVNTLSGAAGTANGNKIYIDGAFIAAAEVQAIPGSTAQGLLTIGSSPGGSSNFPGSLNDIAIWDVVLSADDIASLYNATKDYYAGGTK